MCQLTELLPKILWLDNIWKAVSIMSDLLRVPGRDEPYPAPGYIPRLNSNGMRGNPYWYVRNPYYNVGDGLPNSACYAFGRFWESGDAAGNYSHRPDLVFDTPSHWYDHAEDGYGRSTAPEAGAIACYDYPDDWGFVCVVEEIYETYSICSYSDDNTYFGLMRIPHDGARPGTDYVFQGYILNPYRGGSSFDYRKKPWLWKRILYNREEYNSR